MLRVFQIVFTILVAVLFGPALSEVFNLFTAEGTFEFIARQFTEGGIFSLFSILTYLEIAFWALVFWFIAKPLFLFPLGAIAPFVGMRAETKLMRLARFLSFEVALFFLPAILLALYVLLLAADETFTTAQRVQAVRYIFTEINWVSWWGLILLFIVNLSVLGRSGFYVWLVEFLETGRYGRGGSGRFAGMFEEYATRWKRDSYALFFGNSLFMPWLRIGSESDRHMLTFAGSRGGKGTSCIIPNLLQWEGSALVVDPKGTNAAVTANRRREMGQEVFVLDPFGVLKDEETATINPLDFIDPDSPTVVEDIGRVAEALVIPEPGDRNRHFTDSARDLVSGFVAHIVTTEPEEHRNLYTLRRYLSLAGEERDDLLARMMMNEGAGFLPKIAAQRILNGGSSNELASIVSTALTQTGWLSSAAMRGVLSESTFSFHEMKEEPTTVYVVVPPEHLEFHKRFVRLIINLALAAYSKGGRAYLPGLFIIDEVAALGRMDEIAKAYGLLGGYNMVVWSFFQDKGQLDRLYGEQATSFIANSRAVQVFAVGDDATVDFVVGKLGRSSIKSPANLRGGTEVLPLREKVDVSKEIGRKQFR